MSHISNFTVIYLLEAIALNYLNQVSEQSCQVSLRDFVEIDQVDIDKIPNADCYAACILNNTGFIDDKKEIILSKVKQTETVAPSLLRVQHPAEDCLKKGGQMGTCDYYTDFLNCWLNDMKHS